MFVSAITKEKLLQDSDLLFVTIFRFNLIRQLVAILVDKESTSADPIPIFIDRSALVIDE